MIDEIARRVELCRPLDPVVGRSLGHKLCWFCAKNLPAHFTSVRKNGQRLNVHYGCATPAERVIAGVRVQDNPDEFIAPAFVAEMPIG